jgi:hypothetical protein
MYKPAGKPITQVNIDDGMDAEISEPFPADVRQI